MKFRLTAAAALCAAGVIGANIPFNGSFELGTTGYAIERSIDVKKNPELKFLPLETVPGQSGKALLVRNPSGDRFSVFSKEFRLKNKTKYKLSVKLKGTRAGQRLAVRVFKVDPRWSADGTTFELGTEWKEFSHTYTTSYGDGWYYFNIHTDSARAESRAGDYCLDSLRLEELADTSDDPAEIAVVPAQNLYYKGETAKITLKAFQPGKSPVSGKYTVTVRDDYLGTVIARETVEVSLKPGEAKEIALKSVLLDRFGGFRVSAAGKDGKTFDGFFAVIGKYEAKPFDIHKDFVLAFNGGLHATNLPLENKSLRYTLYNCPQEKEFELLGKLGCRILRDHDGGVRGVDWSSVQREKGKFDFTHLDRQMKLYEKNNIVLFPVIGNGHIEKTRPWQDLRFPEWVKLTRVTNPPPNCMAGARNHVVMPDDAEYYRYIYETAKHLKGRVPVYEITNEPNLYLSPENYVRELKIANEAIKKADPKAGVSGFCLTSDFGVSATLWMSKCVKLDGLKYVDCIGFHPYRGRTLGALRPADSYIADLRAEMKSYGKPDMPLWNTELYYLIDQQVKHDSYEEVFCKVHHCVCRFLIDLGENVVQSIAIPDGYIWKRMLTPHMYTGANFHEFIPSELYVGYNTMARLFEGAKVQHKFRLSNGVICYVFRKDNKLIAAVWNYLGRGVRADFTPFAVMDVYGNEEKPGIKTLKEAPYYLTQGKLKDHEFLDACRNMNILLDQPVTIGEYARVAGDTMHFTLCNDSAKAISGKAGISGTFVAKKMIDFTIPAHGNTVVSIPVKIKDAKADAASVMLIVNKNTVKLPVKVVFNKLIKGVIDMPNMKGTIAFSGNTITVRGKVTDPTDAGATGKRSWWETDCVELFFDRAPFVIDARHGQAYDKNVFRLYITPRNTPYLFTEGGIAAKDCKVTVKQEADGYSFEAVINTPVGKYLGFDIKIDDAPGAVGKVKEIQLGKGKGLYMNRCNFSIAEQQ